MRAALRVGLTGGVTGAVMGSLVNYAVAGMPGSAAANAINHGTTGLIGGFLSGLLGLLTYLRKASAQPGGKSARMLFRFPLLADLVLRLRSPELYQGADPAIASAAAENIAPYGL
ncbi:hypothetical protein [Streptomyces canus]|uniref:hypothetical protein n=1 Tax=Streptomyces canus TaxID=58343 RepID=UPI0033BE3B6B